MINYAHRGASAYAPENTMASFYLGLEMDANGIETDVQRSKDGVLVLHHDKSLKRMTGLDKEVAELDFKELQALDFSGPYPARYRNERIVTLADFLKYFGWKDLHFAIEIKQPGIELEVLAALDGAVPRSRFIITSFHLDSLLTLSRLPNPPPMGYLSKAFSSELLDTLSEAGIGQYCPNAEEISPELMRILRERGFSVRAYGVKNEALMEKIFALGVDGMTVNFPDKLARMFMTIQM